MRFSTVLAVMALAGLILFAAGPVVADEKKMASSGSEKFDAEMAAWMKYSQPSDHHKHLAKQVGTWDVEFKMWPAPGADPMESMGISKNTMALGDRFLHVSYKGEFMGEAFEGMGFSGYDNFLKKHTDLWMDNMGTVMFTSEGHCEKGGKVIKLAGELDDPMTGKKKMLKSVNRMINDDKYMVEMYDKDQNGKEFKHMELTYTRKAGA